MPFARFLSMILSIFAAALALFAGPAGADEISELNDMYESMVALESHLLDEIRTSQDMLNDPNVILLEQGDGSISAIQRNTARDTAGMIFDWSIHWELDEVFRPFLPDEAQAILDMGVETGLGRIEAVDRMVTLVDGNQAVLRDHVRNRLAENERILEKVRTIAANAITARDRLTDQRESEGVIDGSACFDGGAPADSEALVATIGYGGGKYPVKGMFICIGTRSFLWDSGATIREFRCSDPYARPPVCTLYSEMAYERIIDDDTGNIVYRLEDERTFITFF